MKTKPIALLKVKHGIILSLISLQIGVPVFAQVKFSLSKNTLSPGNENTLINNTGIYYTSVESGGASANFSGGNGLYSADRTQTTAPESLSLEKNNNFLKIENNEPLEIAEFVFRPTSYTYPINSKEDIGISYFPKEQLLIYAKILKAYAVKNGFDTQFAFLCNMGILCNRKRFFVVNLSTMDIVESALVSHGRGMGPSVFDKQYSNETKSRSTSLGRYQISKKYKGKYGESYKLIGLDSSNRNAYNRCVVIHAMSCIPDIEDNRPACVSDGCPAVSTKFLTYLNKIIDSRSRPVLMWIFDSNLEEVMLAEKPMIETASTILYNGNF